jgi:hypothetical protein
MDVNGNTVGGDVPVAEMKAQLDKVTPTQPALRAVA